MNVKFDLFGETRPAPEKPVPVAMTIAGSDSGGGAGIQADLKTFAASRVFGTSVLTLVTAQNTVGVTDVRILDEGIIRAQFDAVVSDLKPAATKTGALGDNKTIGLVAALLETASIECLVVDPVMVSKHGHELLPESAYGVLMASLLPLALLVTPNRYEAEALTGRNVEGPSSMKEAAKRIFDFGCKNVLIKGGHFDGIVRDYFYDGTGFIEFGADRIDSKRVHGSGCVYSAAITARLALGEDLVDAVAHARESISSAIEKAPAIGEGISPVNPMYAYWG
ncbi:MAG: bifunctional hydroxymethylpyrimidine kinase/phosphomethylpyrimidine kinase [Bradymonadaceae bacterium]